MKARLFSFCTIIVVAVLMFAGCGNAQADKGPKEITVYAYDSFVADWGPGPELAKKFEAKTGVKVTFVSCGDAAQVLSRAALEKANPVADVLVGIDNNLVEKARAEGVLAAYKPKDADKVVAKDLVLASDWILTPYDWGYFAIMFDAQSGLTPPASLDDLAKPEYAKKLILMDPRTSTPGAGFLAWTVARYGKDYPAYWEKLKANVLTLSPSWDTGYGLFTSGEAPLVISYTTSAAYHVEYDKTDRYQALIFSDGHVAQIEGLGLVKGAKHAKLAKEFIDFMLTDEAQSVLPLTQWMYPVSKTVTLPESFKAAPLAPKTLAVSPADVTAAIDPVVSILTK